MTVTGDGVVSTATWIGNARNGGGTYNGSYPWRVVLHTVEGHAGPATIAAHPYPPHLWYDPALRALYQTVPLGRSAFALYQPPDAPHSTNKARALQVELNGRAAEAADWPKEWLDNIAADVIVPFCQYVALHGDRVDLGDVPEIGAIPGSASASAPQRMPWDRWAGFAGVGSHRHVPGNDHWDTGGLDVAAVATHASRLISGIVPPTTLLEDDMARLFTDPTGTTWVTDGVTAAQLGTSFPTVHKLGLVPPEPQYGQRVNWPDIDDLLAYDFRTDSLRPIRLVRDPAAPAKPPASTVNADQVAAAVLAAVKARL